MKDVELYRDCFVGLQCPKFISYWSKEAGRLETKLLSLGTTAFAELDVDKRSISVTFADHRRFLKPKCMPYNLRKLSCLSVVRFKLDQLLDNL
jgi:hypothetical protein